MSRSHGNAPNTGWPAQGQPSADQDPRAWSGTPQGQRPQQQQPSPQSSPAGGYPPQQATNPSLNRAPGYHYPQQAPTAPAAHEPEPYPATQPQYAQQPHTAQAQHPSRPSGPAGAPYPQSGQRPEPSPDLRGGNYEQWSIPPQSQDPSGYDLGSYMPAGAGQGQSGSQAFPDQLAHNDPLQAQQEWGQHAQQIAGHGDPAMEQAYHGGGQPGYEPAHAGALEQNYQHEDGEYEVEEPRRGSWTMRIAGAVVVAVGLGFGLAQGYKLVVGNSPDGATPLITGASGPAKTKPTDPGGKKFAHTDSKVMGRLGDSTGSSETDASGTRKVQTVVVGRDGSIVPPAEPPQQTGSVSPTVSVPGMTVVDGFGGQFPGANSAPSKAPSAPPKPPAATTQKPIVVKPPSSPQKPVVIARTTPTAKPVNTAPAAAKAPAASTPKKPAPSPAATGGNGYVAVLASVPVSSRSRLAALQRFADMQQKYASVLQNKTPDIREANLGTRGNYHRLLVGPPGSRSQASALCSQLKSAGHKDCWVTAY